MKRNRRDSIKKERIIMVASSVFVLTALTMTGLYMRGQEVERQDDGYTLDFTALGNETGEKLNGIGAEQAKNTGIEEQADVNLEGELDYMPLDEELAAEAGSNLVEIPGLTDGVLENKAKENTKTSDKKSSENNSSDKETSEGGAGDPASENSTPADASEQANQAQEDKKQEDSKESKSKQAAVSLSYNEEQGLTKPVNGEILLPYSMDGSIYFATLDQYKYNPATLFAAEEGDDVVACAAGKITNVYEDAELGHVVCMELGSGYTVTYGQLDNIKVKKDSYVKSGEKLGTVAAPSKYYSLEGTNLYFRMEKDGAPINSETLF